MAAMPAAGAQLALPLELRERNTFAKFLTGANGELVARLRSRQAGFLCLWLYGQPGTGKTHLLQAVCHRDPEACYVPAPALAGQLQSLEGYARFPTATIDDADRWLGRRSAEVALFDFYNQLRAVGGRLIVTAARSPLDCRFALPDLRSRLCAAACYRVAPLAEEDKPALLLRTAKDRGLQLGEDVVRFLLARVSREQGALVEVLEQLDRASLAAQRRITIPFVKETLCL